MSKKISGYCLYSGRGTPKLGEQWWPSPAEIWILQTIKDAKKTEAETDMWHEICRVEGTVDNYWLKDGKIWTNEPHKLFITKIYPQYTPKFDDKAYAKRAKENVSNFANLLNRAISM